MRFTEKDLTDQFISCSYQGVLQHYLLSDNCYILDGLGNVISYILSSSVGKSLITSDITSSMSVMSSSRSVTSLTSDFSLLSGDSISATTASHALTSLTSDFSLLSGDSISATTSSYSLTSSCILGYPTIKSGVVLSSSFSGTPKTSTITFLKSFSNNNYSVTVTGEDSRSWYIQNKNSSSFTINTGSDPELSGSVFWQAITVGEF